MKYAILPLLLAASFLTGCNSDDYTIKLDGVHGRTDVQLINASQVPLDFHIGSFKNNGNAPDIKAQKYRVGSLEAGQDQLQVKVDHNWTDPRLSVQAFQRLTAQGSEYIQHKSEVGKDLTLVAWQEGAQVRLSMFRKSSSSQNGVYRLRLLAIADDVVVQAGSSRLALKKGELSAWFSLDHCLGDLKLNEQVVDVCKATAGQSFLLVADKTRLLSLTQS